VDDASIEFWVEWSGGRCWGELSVEAGSRIALESEFGIGSSGREG
jgi:hypothetical protein